MGMHGCNNCEAYGMSTSKAALHKCEEYLARRKKKYKPALKQSKKEYYLQGKQNTKSINF